MTISIDYEVSRRFLVWLPVRGNIEKAAVVRSTKGRAWPMTKDIHPLTLARSSPERIQYWKQLYSYNTVDYK